MTTAEPGVEAGTFEQFVSAGARLDTSELAAALAAVAEQCHWDHADVVDAVAAALAPSDAELLDAAATLAARHRALTGRIADLRSLLALVAVQRDLEAELAGGPRNVIDDVEQKLMNRTRWRAGAMSAIWLEPMLEAGVAAVALGAKPSNREKTRQYRGRSWLLGLLGARGYLFPEFQFDPRRREVYPAVRAVNEMLDAAGDPWGVASWWFSPHAGLGARPADLVGGHRRVETGSGDNAGADGADTAGTRPDDSDEEATGIGGPAHARTQHWEDDLVAAATAAVEPVG